ncbi:hypothetical protein BDR26DRAFT_939574 [Obelidium mucronatum]|nr:hypothetical protein BDR26DRAFT_939574 [Obelidium mucronatum]
MPPKRRPEEEAAFLQQSSYPSAGLAMIDPNLFTSYHTNIGNPAGNGLPVPTASQQQQQQAASSLKKKRIPACDLCNQKKIKCDGNQGCANCLKSGAACTYERNKDSRMATKRKKTDATAATVATAPLQFQQTMGMPMRPPQQQLGMPGGMMGQGSSSGMSVGLPRQQQLPQQLPQQNYQQHHQHSSMIPPRSSSNMGTTEAGIVPSGATANNTPPPATIPLIGGSMFNPPSGTQATNSSSNLNNTNTLLSAVAPRLSSSTSSNNPFNNTPTSIMLPPGTATSLLPIEQSHQSFIQQSGKSNPLSSIPKEVLDELIDLYFEFIDPAIPDYT